MKRNFLLTFGVLVAFTALLVLAHTRFIRREMPALRQVIPTFPCPVPTSDCANFREVSARGKYYGLGWQITPHTPVYSLFAGPVMPVRAAVYPAFSQPGLALESKDKKWRVVYVFTGPDSDRYTVAYSAGETLLYARQGRVASFEANLVLRLYRLIDGKSQLQKAQQFRFQPL